MSTQYICHNCQELYSQPRRKNAICKTCADAVNRVEEVINKKLAADIFALEERAARDRKNAAAIVLLKRYKPPTVNDHLRITK